MASSIFQVNFPQAVSLQKSADEADFIIGLDLHKKTTAVCVIDTHHPETPVRQRKRVPNSEVVERLNSFQGKKFVVAEAAYGWFPIRKALAPYDTITFSIFDPRKTSSWIGTSGIKNDKIDAQVLAYACLHGGVTRLAVHQPGTEAKERFRLVNLRDKLVTTTIIEEGFRRWTWSPGRSLLPLLARDHHLRMVIRQLHYFLPR